MRNAIEHRCEGCDELVGTGPATRLAIGRPFAECPRCGAYVPRRPYAEWPLLRPAARLGYLLSRSTFALALGLLPALVLGTVSIATGRAGGRTTLLAVAAAGLVVSLGIGLGRFLDAVHRSRRRMSDPMYRARLAEYEMGTRRRPAAPA